MSDPAAAVLSVCTTTEMFMTVSQEVGEIPTFLYVEWKELRQAAVMQRTLKYAAIMAFKQHIMPRKRYGATRTEMAAAFKKR